VSHAGVEYVEADLARRPVDKICSDDALSATFLPDGLMPTGSYGSSTDISNCFGFKHFGD
jgi:hypothetical protein